MSFDWNHIRMIAITPTQSFDPSAILKRPSQNATDLFVGKTPLGSTPGLIIDGMLIDLIGKSFKFTTKVTDPITLSNNEKKLNLKLDNGDFQFIELNNILNELELSLLKQWITKQSQQLVRIANEYEKNHRQFYHFMYDMIALVKAASKLPSEYRFTLIDTVDAGDKLMHNRILAEISSAYVNNHVVKIEPRNKGSTRKPDLAIDGLLSDVKTVLTISANDRESLSDFAHKLRKDIDEKEMFKNQTGTNGFLFIAPWSGIANSILYTFFHKMKIDGKHSFEGAIFYENLPTPNKNKTIFVLTSHNAFQNGYLVFDTKWVSKIIEDFVEQGYPLIDRYEPFSYLTLTNIRKGCPLGISDMNSSIIFHVR